MFVHEGVNKDCLNESLAKAKSFSLPKENIERAIRRGTGEEPGVQYEEITYEGYGPSGVALMIESLTDNKNRTVGEIRFLLGKHNGNLGAENSVAWMFHRKGHVLIEKGKVDEEKLLNVALEAGAEDVNDDGAVWEIVTPPEATGMTFNEAGPVPAQGHIAQQVFWYSAFTAPMTKPGPVVNADGSPKWRMAPSP